MSNRHDDNDGSDIFWPGYVDATTNLILNLLFLLTILIVAVFMFALELGRSSKAVSENPPIESAVNLNAKFAAAAPIEVAPQEQPAGLNSPEEAKTEGAKSAAAKIDATEENIALKLEIERLNALLEEQTAEKEPSAGFVETVDATSSLQKPLTGLERTLVSDLEVRVRFTDDAIEFTPAERERLLEALKPIVAKGQPTIFVEVPAGFSEAKRMGFYRAMAVRNLLIEMKLPQENIDVRVIEGKYYANASIVRVRSN